jgi:predicted dehydrogenase
MRKSFSTCAALVVRGGGPVYDMGVYCINAARCLFRSEPTDVFASTAKGDRVRFRNTEEMSSVVLKFPEDAEGNKFSVMVDGKTVRQNFPKRDQFAAEIGYFSECILKNREPEHSGREGMAEVRIVEAIYRSARAGNW